MWFFFQSVNDNTLDDMATPPFRMAYLLEVAFSRVGILPSVRKPSFRQSRSTTSQIFLLRFVVSWLAHFHLLLCVELLIVFIAQTWRHSEVVFSVIQLLTSPVVYRVSPCILLYFLGIDWPWCCYGWHPGGLKVVLGLPQAPAF